MADVPDAAPTPGPMLSVAQERVWFLGAVYGENPAFSVAELWIRSGPAPSAERLRQSAARLAARREILCHTFPSVDGQPTVHTRPCGAADMAAVVRWEATADDITDRDEWLGAARRWAGEWARVLFDVGRGPLWRVAVLPHGVGGHALLLVAHRLVADRPSLQVMRDDLDTLLVGGDIPVACQYADLAEQQRELLGRDSLETDLQARLHALAGAPAGIDLPTLRRRPTTLTFSGAHVRRGLPESMVDQVTALAEERATTPEVIFLAAFVVLVHRFTAAEDIVVGAPSRDPARVVGPLTNLTVLRLGLSGDPAFGAVIDRVRRELRHAQASAHVPFEVVIERLHPDRDLGQRPVCQLGYAFDTVPAGDESVIFDVGGAVFDLALRVRAATAGTELIIEYDTDLIDPGMADELADSLVTLLGSATAAPATPVGRQRLLTIEQTLRITEERNDTHIDSDRRHLVHQAIAEEAARRPQAIALVAGDRRMTYGELDGRANQAANFLRMRGVRSGDTVGVCMPRSIDMVVGVLGIYKAGAVAVLLDPAHPAKRLGSMLDDSGASVLLTVTSILASLPVTYGGQAICVDRDRELLDQADSSPPVVLVRWSSPCQIAYTSGSTGEPRGVVFRHGAVLLAARGSRRCYSLTAADRGSWISAPGFGISFVNELWPFLTVGASVAIADDADVVSPFKLRDWLLTREITVALLTRVLAERVCATDWPWSAPLRVLMVSGERVGWLPASLPFEVVTIYGSTEVTNATTCLNETDDVRLTPKAVPPERRVGHGSPVGKPVPNSRVYILDSNLEPVPDGVEGKIFVGGELIQGGYLNRPSATAGKWVPDPYATQPGARMVATGDVGRTLPGGAIEMLGRADDQVSLNGYRIELGEIAAQLLEHPAVRQAEVMVREDEPGQRRLVGYVVADPSRRPSHADLRDVLKEHLPAYLVPGTFILLDALPVLANGKVDRRALPAAPEVAGGASRPYVAPRTPGEQRLADIWQRVLRQERVGVHDNYFELGGDSLTGMELMAAVGTELDTDLPLRTLFEAPTVEEMVDAVERTRDGPSPRAAERSSRSPVTPDASHRYEPFPLTDIQHAYWIGRAGGIELGDVGCHGYQEWDVADLDVGRLRRAIHRLVGRHDMLRAVTMKDGAQRVLSDVPSYEPEITDLRSLAPATRARRLGEMRERLSHEVMEADRWPLFELRVTRMDAMHSRVHVSFDLLIFDARSARLFTQELAALYHDPHLRLSPLELSFRDYVLAEREWRANSPEHRASVEYWQGRLATLPQAPELPYLRPLSSVRNPRFTRHAGRLDPVTWRRLRQAAADAGITPSALLLAGFSEVIGAWSASSRFTVNLTLFNRPPLHPQLNDILGDFTSGLLLAVEDVGETFQDFARAVQEQLWSDLQHRSVSSVQVMRDLTRGQAVGGPKAVMPVVFSSLVGVPRMEWGALGRYVYGVTQTPQVALDHQVMEVDGGLEYYWDAVAELFPDGLLDDMTAAYGGLLNRLATDERSWRQSRQLDIPAVQANRRARINATETPPPAGLLHDAFVDRAAELPNAPAVIDSGQCLSYGRLDRFSAGLAARLTELGAAPGRLVGIVMNRSAARIGAVLGVSRSGAAYLPIDPALPTERVRYLLRNGNVGIVVTERDVDATLTWPGTVSTVVVDRDALPPPVGPLPSAPASPDDLAYVIYTSGSTGAPKGVMIEHRAALNTVADINQRLRIGPSDAVLGVSSLSFDLSVWDIFGTLGAGGRIVVPPLSRTPDPATWADLLERQGVTVWNSVPALLQLLMGQVRGRGRHLPSSLRHVMLSGDWIPPSMWENLRELAPNAAMLSLGGATEASIWSIMHEVGSPAPDWASVPYGRPLANQRWHVLDEKLRAKPDWVTGGLYIAGSGLARGYWRDPDKTRERFVIHPQTAERLYRTGDLGRYRPSGDLEILGREDFQVKISGNRVELGEIETALTSHRAVRTCCVVARGDPRGARYLVAFVVPEDDDPPTAEELRAFLAGKLPGDVVPARYTMIPAIPLTLNGKVDHAALTVAGEPDGPIDAAEGVVAAATPTEEVLTRIVRSVLDTTRVGTTDNFFACGGDSLRALDVVNQAAEDGLDIPLPMFFQHPTVRALAAHLDGGIAGHDDEPIIVDLRTEER